MFETDNDITITITPKNPESRWVTLDEENRIISEGKTPDEAIEAAKKTNQSYTVMFVPKEGNTYIF
jgi:predicted RNase H-like HicB family nuclease